MSATGDCNDVLLDVEGLARIGSTYLQEDGYGQKITKDLVLIPTSNMPSQMWLLCSLDPELPERFHVRTLADVISGAMQFGYLKGQSEARRYQGVRTGGQAKP